MNDGRATALQLCQFSDYLEARLSERAHVIRWFELDEGKRTAWLANHASSVRAVITGGHVGCGNSLMEVLPKLGLIDINGVGVDKVDLSFARNRGVQVTTTPGVLTDDVADLAVGLIISLLRGIASADAYARSGSWIRGDFPLTRKVSGRRFGIVGLGRVGLAIAARLTAFGPVAYMDQIRHPEVPYEFHGELKVLARNTDVLVIACPANESTYHLVDAGVIEALGPKGYLVNIARGSIVDEAALVSAVAGGRLAGAALDVFENEPNVPEELRASPKVLLTPHIASATIETRTAMADLVIANLDAFLEGRPLPSAVT
jgi:lactate dehydrogenase-like 2-hydroxyacid dehydrogenase